MYFSRIVLRGETASTGRLTWLLGGDGYRLHQMLWRLFPHREARDFLYRQVLDQSWPTFYVISDSPPVDGDGLWRLQVKDYHPELEVGERLAFSLCANPVVSRRREMNGRKQVIRHDVIMDAKHRCRSQGEDVADHARLVQEVGASWLAARGENRGFRLEGVRVDGYRQHRFFKGRGVSPIRFSTVEFNGVLTVMDPDAFRETLLHGLGPAKGFGCGLMLVRRC